VVAVGADPRPAVAVSARLSRSAYARRWRPPGASSPAAVAVDGAHVYWTNFTGGSIGRANLDGTGADQSFITGASSAAGIAMAPTIADLVASVQGLGLPQGIERSLLAKLAAAQRGRGVRQPRRVHQPRRGPQRKADRSCRRRRADRRRRGGARRAGLRRAVTRAPRRRQRLPRPGRRSAAPMAGRDGGRLPDGAARVDEREHTDAREACGAQQEGILDPERVECRANQRPE
jgi:hypothetical protein